MELLIRVTVKSSDFAFNRKDGVPTEKVAAKALQHIQRKIEESCFWIGDNEFELKDVQKVEGLQEVTR